MAVNQPQLQLAIEGPSKSPTAKQKSTVCVSRTWNADVKDVKVSLRSDPESGSGTTIGDIVAGGERVVEVELNLPASGQHHHLGRSGQRCMQLRTERKARFKSSSNKQFECGLVVAASSLHPYRGVL